MISGMTAFSRQSIEAEWGTAAWELRTVNHRYLEVDIRLPEALRELEVDLRDAVSSVLKRGKVECYLKYRPSSVAMGVSINESLLGQLSKASQEIEAGWGGGALSTSMVDLMNWPGILQSPEVDKEVLQSAVCTLFKGALESITTMRKREGEAVAHRIETRLDEVLKEVEKIKARLPIVMKHQREKIQKRMSDLDLSIEPKRLEEELLFLIQKMDVSEEIERLEIHVEEVRQTLKKDRAVGRRLDFLMQELHREANTLGSKSADTEVTHAGIHLKVLIEQMREQVQNIE